MEALNLTDKLPSGRSYTEEQPPGTHQRSSGSAGYDTGRITLNIKIMGSWRNVRGLIKQTVGYSQVWPIFDPNNPAQQGPYRLSRIVPARHPRLRGLRCTQIVSWQGVGASKLAANITEKGDVGEGHIGCPEYIYATLLFEVPRYPMLTDEEMSYTLHGVEQRKPEYVRFLEWDYDTSVETLARKAQIWKYCFPAANAAQPAGFAGDRLLRQAKGVLKWKWHNVAEDFVRLGKIVPTNYANRNSSVNASAFPAYAYRDQNKALASANPYAQFGPGTLLLIPPKITPRPMCHPSVLSGVEVGDLVKRGVDVEGSALHFNPPTDDTTEIDLSAVGGSANTKIRGHNLVSLTQRRAGTVAPFGLWYAAHTGEGGFPPANDVDLLHQYSNWEQLFAAVESMPTW